MKKQLTRRRFLGITAAGGGMLGGLVSCGAGEQDQAPSVRQPARAPERTHGRVVILGFDGVKPDIIEAMMDGGALPNFARLREQGAYARLRSTIPPQSPTAWTSFTTCKNPGGHGIYDFVRREPRSYLPDTGTGTVRHAELTPNGQVSRPAQAFTYRQGEAFWTVADRAGLASTILNVPFAFPPDPLRHGRMLCGLGVPDLRGATSTFFSMSDSFAPEALDERIAGGMRLPLVFSGDTATVRIPGARDTRVASVLEPGAWAEETLSVTADRGNRRLRIELGGQVLNVPERAWSDWAEWTFRVSDANAVRAISRFYPLEVGGSVRLYMSCLQFHPGAPYIPYTVPEDYAGALADRYGLYKTIGWAYDTHALRSGDLDEEAWLADLYDTYAWRETLTLDELDRGEADLVASVWTATDRAAHMFWRFRDPAHPLYSEAGAEEYGRILEELYQRVDTTVGKVLERLNAGDLLMVLSDHGFDTFRTGFNLNTWLVQNGYAALEDGAPHSERDWLQAFDWSRTRAYAIGLSSVYLNLRGRERHGIVAPAEAGALREELRERLLAVTDPEAGARVFSNVYDRSVYRGVATDEAPDLSLGYAAPYQNSKETVRGGAPAGLFLPNLDKWSGEHAASDTDQTPGIFFASQAIGKDSPSIIDLGVTALACLGVAAPEDFEGQALVSAPPEVPERAAES